MGMGVTMVTVMIAMDITMVMAIYQASEMREYILCILGYLPAKVEPIFY